MKFPLSGIPIALSRPSAAGCIAVIVEICSQKEGFGKSSLVALQYAAAEWNVKIADLDVSQETTFNWQGRRLHHVAPVIAAEHFGIG